MSKNKPLDLKTKQIKIALNSSHTCTLKIAKYLQTIEESEAYKPDFESVFDYAFLRFGFKKSYTYKLLQISPLITNEFKTVLDDDRQSYSAAQLIELCSCRNSATLWHEIVEKGLINSSMPAKEIRAVIKAYKQKNKPSTVDDGTITLAKVNKATKAYILKISQLLQEINTGETIFMDNLGEEKASAYIKKDKDQTEISMLLKSEEK